MIAAKTKSILGGLVALGWPFVIAVPAEAQIVKEISKTPCPSTETPRLEIFRLNRLTNLIPLEHLVERRVGQVRFRVPWAFVRPPLAYLNCPQSGDGGIYFFFWMPDRKPPAREANTDLVGHQLFQPPEAGRMPGRDHLVRVSVNPPSKPGERLAWTVPDLIRKAGGADALPHEFGMLRLPVYGGATDKSAPRDWVQLSERQIVSLRCWDRRGTHAPSVCDAYAQIKDPDFDLRIRFLDEYYHQTPEIIVAIRKFLSMWRVNADLQ
jgi:hypothetical protein